MSGTGLSASRPWSQLRKQQLRKSNIPQNTAHRGVPGSTVLPHPGTTDVWGQIISVEATLCTVGYQAASLASAHLLSIAHNPGGTTKNVSRHCSTSTRGWSCLVRMPSCPACWAASAHAIVHPAFSTHHQPLFHPSGGYNPEASPLGSLPCLP